MLFEIPVSIDPTVDDITFDVELDGRTYLIRLSYSSIDDRWYCDLYLARATQAPELIVAGQALCAYRMLLDGCTHPDKPLGQLFVNTAADPARADLGTAARLYYADAAEIAALAAP